MFAKLSVFALLAVTANSFAAPNALDEGAGILARQVGVTCTGLTGFVP